MFFEECREGVESTNRAEAVCGFEDTIEVGTSDGVYEDAVISCGVGTAIVVIEFVGDDILDVLFMIWEPVCDCFKRVSLAWRDVRGGALECGEGNIVGDRWVRVKFVAGGGDELLTKTITKQRVWFSDSLE
jgi:hypothetical protein